MLHSIKHATEAVELYKDLFKLRESLTEIFNNKDAEFCIVSKHTWCKSPISSDVAFPLMREYYKSQIEQVEKKLMDLGFTPDCEEPA